MIDRKFIRRMAHSPVENYMIPGLTSYLIGSAGPHGITRLFIASRDQTSFITPHSHRYDLHSVVLSGRVVNRIWSPRSTTEKGDLFRATQIEYTSMGRYTRGDSKIGAWSYEDKEYKEGDSYTMMHNEINSIVFSRGTEVLIFESENRSPAMLTTILEPCDERGETFETLEVKPWMFKR